MLGTITFGGAATIFGEKHQQPGHIPGEGPLSVLHVSVHNNYSRGNGVLRYTVEKEHIHWNKAEILRCTDKPCISMIAGEELQVDQIIHATGFVTPPHVHILSTELPQRMI